METHTGLAGRRGRHAFALLGVVLLVALVLVGTRMFDRAPTVAPGPACDSTWVWHFTEGEADMSLPVFRTMLDSMPEGTTVRVAASSRAEEERCRRELGDAVKIVTVDGPVTPWARDRYLLFEKDGGHTALVPAARRVRPESRGDLLVPAALLELHPDLVVVETEFLIEGGDVLVLGDRVLLGTASVLHNAGTLGPGADAFLAEVAEVFGREVLVVGRSVGEAPYPHLDMFLTALDDLTVVLGDPRRALSAFRDEEGTLGSRLDLGDLGVFLRHRQLALCKTYDRIARELEDAGFEVRRLPVLHGQPTPMNPWGTVLSWNNVLLESDGVQRLAFVPRYDVAGLDERARRLWEGWGYAVVTVDLRRALAIGGALRCLTNVMTYCRGAL